MISFIAFVFSIVILVFIHELGHYLAARSVGVKVEKFYIGFNLFGYALFKKQVNGTEYGIGWFPLGGYVKLAGMLDESLDTSASDVPKENQLQYQSPLAKIWIMSAGVIMNFLLAIIIFTTMSFNNGLPEASTDEPIIGNVSEVIMNVDGDFIKKTAAHKLGLKSGDKIIQIDNVSINNWDDMSLAIRNKPDEIINVKWISESQIKEGAVRTDTVTTLIDYKIKTIGKLGIGPDIKIRELSFIEALLNGFMMTSDFLFQMVFSLYSLISGQISIEHLSGPLGIAQVAGDSAKAGFEPLFYLIAILSINLGLVNILPIPGLDGGHIFITLIEVILRKDLTLNAKVAIQNIGMLFLLSLFILVMFNDVVRLFFN